VASSTGAVSHRNPPVRVVIGIALPHIANPRDRPLVAVELSGMTVIKEASYEQMGWRSRAPSTHSEGGRLSSDRVWNRIQHILSGLRNFVRLVASNQSFRTDFKIHQGAESNDIPGKIPRELDR
jgi:hypothetical protein